MYAELSVEDVAKLQHYTSTLNISIHTQERSWESALNFNGIRQFCTAINDTDLQLTLTLWEAKLQSTYLYN